MEQEEVLSDICNVHRKQLEFFCETDDEFCCSRCAVISHRLCPNIIEVEKLSEWKETEIADLKQELLDTETKAANAVQRLRNIKYKFVSDVTEVKNKIQNAQEKVNEIFDKLKESVAEQVAQFQDKAFKDLDEKETSIEVSVDEMKEVLDKLKEGTVTLYSLKNLKYIVGQRRTKIEDVEKDTQEIDISFQFDENLALPPSDSTTLGNLTVEYVSTADSLCDGYGDLQLSLKFATSIDIKAGGGNVDEPLYSGLDFLPDGRLVAVDNMNYKFVVFDQQLKILSAYPLQQKPLKVAVVSEEEVAITTWNVVFLRVSKSNEVTYVRTCVVTRIYESICKLDDKNFLVGTVNDHKHVRMFSAEGEETDLVLNFPMTTYELDHSNCTYIRSCQKVVLADRYANTVNIYTVGSSKRVEVTDEELIKEPCGLAVGPGDTIFVCSDMTNSIVQISHTGAILENFELDMECPRTICISSDNRKLAVSNGCSGHLKLQLFDIELK